MRLTRCNTETLRLSQAVNIASGRVERTVTGPTTLAALVNAEAAAAQMGRDAKQLQMALRGEIAALQAAERAQAKERAKWEARETGGLAVQS